MIDTSKINKKRVQNLVDALRSGKYKQTFGRLRKNDCYCVMGVACNVSQVVNWVNCHSGVMSEFYRYDDCAATLPRSVLKYYGFNIDRSIIPVMKDGKEKSIASLNDSDELPFSELADLIEETYLKSTQITMRADKE